LKLGRTFQFSCFAATSEVVFAGKKGNSLIESSESLFLNCGVSSIYLFDCRSLTGDLPEIHTPSPVSLLCEPEFAEDLNRFWRRVWRRAERIGDRVGFWRI
jgi:hypothetical protein